MRKIGKLISFVLLTLIILSNILIFAEIRLPEKNKEFYVYDEANLLSKEIEKKIVDINLKYEQTEEQPQVVVATVNSLQGETIEKYATELFEKWKIGNKDLDNGILILLSLEERKVRIEVGYGLEGAVTDSQAGKIIGKATTYLKEDNFNNGIETIFIQLVEEINKEYEYSNESILSAEDIDKIQKESETNRTALIITIIMLVIVFVSIALIVLLENSGYDGGFDGFGGSGSSGGWENSSGGSFGDGGSSGGGGASGSF